MNVDYLSSIEAISKAWYKEQKICLLGKIPCTICDYTFGNNAGCVVANNYSTLLALSRIYDDAEIQIDSINNHILVIKNKIIMAAITAGGTITHFFINNEIFWGFFNSLKSDDISYQIEKLKKEYGQSLMNINDHGIYFI